MPGKSLGSRPCVSLMATIRTLLLLLLLLELYVPLPALLPPPLRLSRLPRTTVTAGANSGWVCAPSLCLVGSSTGGASSSRSSGVAVVGILGEERRGGLPGGRCGVTMAASGVRQRISDTACPTRET